jgi:hypothetical protein
VVDPTWPQYFLHKNAPLDFDSNTYQAVGLQMFYPRLDKCNLRSDGDKEKLVRLCFVPFLYRMKSLMRAQEEIK